MNNKELLKTINDIQDKLILTNSYIKLSSTSDDDKLELFKELKLISGLADLEIKNHDKNIKEALELSDTFEFGFRKYYYQVSYKTLFDSEKAKRDLEKNGANLEDYQKTSTVRKLASSLNN